jgi:recombination protein RecR
MNITISKLSSYFEKLPGIGPRQARRFVYFLLTQDEEFLKKLANLIINLKKEVVQCKTCQRFFETANNNNQCKLCHNTSRDKTTLLIVEKDIDLDNIEKSGFYNGSYYVLGGLVPALGEDLPKEIKMKELFEKVKESASKKEIKEIIIALSATLEGDNTIRYIEKILEPITKKVEIKISRLGRGLSTGTELEYSDKDTIVNAFKNRQ